MDGDKLVGVFFPLVVARGLRKGDGRRDVLLVIKVGKRRQRTGRRDRGEGKDRVSRGRGTQTSVRFCGCFTG